MKLLGSTTSVILQLATIAGTASALDLGYMCEHENFGGACTVFRADSLGWCGSYTFHLSHILLSFALILNSTSVQCSRRVW